MSRVVLLVAALGVGLPAAASAFERSRIPGSDPLNPTPLFWCSRKVPFATNMKGSQDGGQETFAAVRRSFQAWSEPSCTDLTFEDQGTTPRSDVGYSQTSNDNLNLVVWREVTCAKAAPAGDACFKEGGCNNKYNCWEQPSQTIAVTTTTYNNKTGEIYDADVEFNGAGFVFTTLDSPLCTKTPTRPPTCVATDIQNTLTHEAGHVIGLDHPAGVESTMYAQASLGETKKRTLHQDDIDGVCFIYPKGEETTECAALTPDLPAGCGCAGAGASPAAGGVAAVLLGLFLSGRRRRC